MNEMTEFVSNALGQVLMSPVDIVEYYNYIISPPRPTGDCLIYNGNTVPIKVLSLRIILPPWRGLDRTETETVVNFTTGSASAWNTSLVGSKIQVNGQLYNIKYVYQSSITGIKDKTEVKVECIVEVRD